VGELDHPGGVDDGAATRSPPTRMRQRGAIAELGLEVVEIERGIGMEVHVLTVNPRSRRAPPRRHARVMVQGADEDLVTSLEVAARRARQREVDRAHVRAEADLMGLSARNRAAAASAPPRRAPTRSLVSYGAPMFPLATR
jgi:hypothetical protein